MNNDIEEQPPIICDVCLGDSDDIRMTKTKHGAQCKICTLPFTIYHFKPHKRDANLTRTLICTRCSKQRNTCQCCMLDMTWHIPVQLRDQLISMLTKDSSNNTEEAKNDMMKRFLALKDVKLGGARITSDPEELNNLMTKLQDILHNKESPPAALTAPSEITNTKNDKFKSVDISHLLRKIPLNESFCKESATKSFFLYNIDPSIPEWKVSSAIAQVINTKEWQDPTSTSLIINHKAKCGGIRFKNENLSSKFVDEVLGTKSNSFIKTAKGLQRGILKIDHFQVFLVPWKSGFSAGSFGNNTNENIKLSLSLDKLIRMESVTGGGHVDDTKVLTAATTKKNKKYSNNNKKGKVTKNKSKVKRVSNLEL